MPPRPMLLRSAKRWPVMRSPVPEGRQLRLSNGGPRHRLPILFAEDEPFDERRTRRLARFRRCKENLLQDRVSLKLGISEMFGEARLIEVHDVLAASRRRAHEDYSAKDRGTIQRHLLRDHAAEREAENVDGREAKPVQKGQGMLCHASDRIRHLARRSSETCAFEQYDLAVARKRVSDRGIPVIERTGEVLKEQQGKSCTRPEAPVSTGFIARLQKSSWSGPCSRSLKYFIR